MEEKKYIELTKKEKEYFYSNIPGDLGESWKDFGEITKDGKVVLKSVDGKDTKIMDVDVNLENLKLEDWKKEKKDVIFTRRGQIENFLENQPFFYDKSKMFWLWNSEENKWELSDEVDFLNSIQEKLGVDTINSKTRIELIEGFKQIGRKHKPIEPKKCWIQFGKKIYDIENGDIFEASPKYFITNPIPYDVGDSEETPTMDKLFVEWVGEKNKNLLYEIISYILSTDQFMQRLFAFCGGGSNGKGTFIKLIYKFIGNHNFTSSEIKGLSESRFEVASLYKKLLCIAGEVSYDDLKNTNILKKISGEDKLSFEFKGKDSFTDDNTATFICLTNSLPSTPDKSLGFYRRWLIVDFPNQFEGIKNDLISEIPEVEFQNLARKSLRILKELSESRKFTNEGTFQERVDRYEDHSNPVMRFVEDHCEECEGEKITLRDFTNKCNDFLKNKHLRILTAFQIGKILRNEGFEIGKRKQMGVSGTYVLNIKVNIDGAQNYSNYPFLNSFSHVDSISDLGSSSSSSSSQDKLSDFTDEEIKKTGYTREELNNFK